MIGDVDVAWSERLARRDAINRFCAKQRQVKQWVSFWELVELYARPSRLPEETKRSEGEAFKKLADSICRGEFGRKVLYVSDRPGAPFRMTRERLEFAIEICRGPRGWEMLRTGWLEPCWIPVALAITWCRSCKIEVPVGWQVSIDRKTTWPVSGPQRRRGRPPTVDRAAVKKFVFDVMEQEGEFAAVDANWNAQARLEERVSRFLKDAVVESTVRNYTTKYVKEWREYRRQ
jgi:hypothetical protein